MNKFKCSGDDNEHIPEEFLQLGISFPEAYSERTYMTRLSKELKIYKKDNICFLPFCMTVLPEAFGAKINLGDYKYLPRVKEYAINSIEEVDNLSEINFNSGRIKEVLDSIKALKDDNQYVGLKVEGTFTVITSIMEPRVFYKLLRKDEHKALEIIEKVEKGILEYIKEGVKRGADIISYGDSSGVESIVGKNIYLNYSGKSSCNIIRNFKKNIDNSLIHVCGLTFSSLYNNDFIDFNPIKYDSNLTYGEGIINILNERNSIKALGGRCIKNTNKLLNEPLAYEITLK
ncbi:uroporphyrinogen decarboxylase family protein [uncultured Clostridium sp.]|uniref:uroporphyrinogen decarboxylase family protein n=1 Tax=uncultured Clostridium sp. TaxID=59620 RepID=UPI0025865BB3|nr:uroporphyrinogen decarboxylase family protein [uncultured Clostridium sp.]MDU1350763.1 uroporphyrinogen decarboxylase family protein [Clostridium argentinense]